MLCSKNIRRKFPRILNRIPNFFPNITLLLPMLCLILPKINESKYVCCSIEIKVKHPSLNESIQSIQANLNNISSLHI